MKNITRLSGILVLACLFSMCSPPEMQESFLPSARNLREGIVHKYYITDTPKNRNDQPRTNIQYRHYKQDKTDVITEQRFSPSMRIETERQYVQEGQNVKLLSHKQIYYDDTTHFDIKANNNVINFDGANVSYEASATYKNAYKFRRLQNIKGARDTIINEKEAKIVLNEAAIFTENKDAKRDTFEFKSEEVYVKGMGLWSLHSEDEKSTTNFLLVEQIRPETFWKMQAHNVNRGGYIDFDKTLDKDEPFELCRAYHQINDYYNITPHAGFIGGKKPLWAYIIQRLNPNMLHNESGYLTFRFVVNCKGEAGRFSTDQADLDFQKKEFDSQTIEHCYNILKSIPKWQYITAREEARDAYTYITFKLENGKLIELLP